MKHRTFWGIWHRHTQRGAQPATRADQPANSNAQLRFRPGLAWTEQRAVLRMCCRLRCVSISSMAAVPY